MSEKSYEKHAWILLFAAAIFIFIGGLVVATSAGRDLDFPAIAGITHDELRSSNPGVADYIAFIVRGLGSFMMGFAVLTMAIAWKSYRNGEKWAWYVLWSFPVIYGLAAAISLSAGGVNWPLFIALLIVALIGLLLPIRKFFPKS